MFLCVPIYRLFRAVHGQVFFGLKVIPYVFYLYMVEELVRGIVPLRRLDHSHLPGTADQPVATTIHA